MILVCDSYVSERAISLRDKLFSLGIPCAVSDVAYIKHHLPIKLIITFTEAFDSIRRGPYDDIFVIAIGNGFVNTALNAVRADDISSALRIAKDRLIMAFGVDKGDIIPSGISVNGIFFSDLFFEIYGNMIIPTKTEYMLFKHILYCSYEKSYATVESIREFCYSKDNKVIEANVISAHISNLNKKINEAYGKKIIKSKRFNGYYIEKI